MGSLSTTTCYFFNRLDYDFPRDLEFDLRFISMIRSLFRINSVSLTCFSRSSAFSSWSSSFYWARYCFLFTYLEICAVEVDADGSVCSLSMISSCLLSLSAKSMLLSTGKIVSCFYLNFSNLLASDCSLYFSFLCLSLRFTISSFLSVSNSSFSYSTCSSFCSASSSFY